MEPCGSIADLDNAEIHSHAEPGPTELGKDYITGCKRITNGGVSARGSLVAPSQRSSIRNKAALHHLLS